MINQTVFRRLNNNLLHNFTRETVLTHSNKATKMDKQYKYVNITDCKTPDFERALNPIVQMRSNGADKLVYGGAQTLTKITTETTSTTISTTPASTVSTTPYVFPSSSTNNSRNGTVFWLAFPENIRQSWEVRLKLLVLSKSNTTVTAESRIPTKETHPVNNINHTIIDMGNSLEQQINIIQSKSVFVISEEAITLYAYSDYSGLDAGLTWIPPIEKLGTDYITVSYQPEELFYSFISIVSIEDDTIVNITISTNGSVSLHNDTYQSGDTIVLTLDKSNTFQLSHENDLTGSRIRSDKPIMVQSGDTVLHITNSRGGDAYAGVSLPPVSSWGTTFVIPPLRDAKRMIIRVILSQENTEVQIHGENGTNSYQTNDTLDTQVSTSGMFIVTCDKPCYVAQFAVSEPDWEIICFMIAIPAVQQYSRDYHVITPGKKIQSVHIYKTNYIAIMIASEDADQLILDESAISNYNADVKSLNATGQSWTVLTVSVKEGVHLIKHLSDHALYGGMAYGFGYSVSYGYGFELNI